MTFRSPFMSYAFQLRYTRSFGHISQSLNIYPVLSDDDPVFRMCQNGDLLGLQAALSRKGVSPFVTDTNQGWTLLHVGIEFPLLLIHSCSLTDVSTPLLTYNPRSVIGYYRLA